MRAIRSGIIAAGLLGLGSAAFGQAQSKVEQMLAFRPSQPGVEIDSPTEAAAIAACKVEPVTAPGGGNIGLMLRDGSGRVLRKVVDANPKKTKRGTEDKPYAHYDQWSYYQNGFEVYRDVDTDEDGAIDEARWVNAGGTRIGVVKNRKIVAWKRISAEEASKVLVQAVQNGDGELLATVMATPEDLTAVGAPKSVIAAATAAAAKRAEALRTLKAGLAGWDAKTIWQRFDGTMPHVIPADAGLAADLELYENAFIFVGPADGQGDPMKVAYLQAPELVKVGETWKFLELPRAIDPKAPPTAVAEGGLRGSLFKEADTQTAGARESSPAHQKALAALAEYDQKNTPEPDAPKANLVKYLRNRLELMRPVIDTAPDAETKMNFAKQSIDTLAQAYQTGLYPEAAGVLDKFVAQGGKAGSFAAYRRLLAEYEQELNEPGANEVAVQKKFITKLEGFLKDFAKADEVPDVLLQLASISEFNLEEAAAKGYYARASEDYPNSPVGRKAAGALRRLNLVGKPFEMTGKTVDGKTVSTAAYAGKTLLVVFWTSDYDPGRREIEKLDALHKKYANKGFEVLSVNLDAEVASFSAYLKDHPLASWRHIHEEGGMDSRPADEFGIFSVPTMILVDPTGKVVNRNIRSAAELERYLEKQAATDGGTTAKVTRRAD